MGYLPVPGRIDPGYLDAVTLERPKSSLGSTRSGPQSRFDHAATGNADEADEMRLILERARRNGIDPRRVVLALGLDPRTLIDPSSTTPRR